jgi:hypothetical protein
MNQIMRYFLSMRLTDFPVIRYVASWNGHVADHLPSSIIFHWKSDSNTPEVCLTLGNCATRIQFLSMKS